MLIDKEKNLIQTSIPDQDRQRWPQDNPMPTPQSIQDLFRRPSFIENNDHVQMAFQGGPRKRTGWKLVLWMWSATTIDYLILMALSCAFMICYSLFLKKVDFELYKQTLQTSYFLSVLVGSLFVSSIVYFIFMRGFIGATVGEWACALRCGKPHERLDSLYILRVTYRVMLHLCTGLLLFPLLSMILRKDISGQITKLSIYSLK